MSYIVAITCALLFAIAFAAAWPLLGRLDNELGADMTATRQHHLRDTVRRWLGTHRLPRMEHQMADMITLLNGLVTQSKEASAAQQASFLNIHNALTRQGQQITDLQQQLADAAANSGAVTPEMQAKADEIAQSLADIRKGAETADDGFEPVDPEPAPVEPGDGDTLPEDALPGDDTPTVPVEDVPVEQPAENDTRRR